MSSSPLLANGPPRSPGDGNLTLAPPFVEEYELESGAWKRVKRLWSNHISRPLSRWTCTQQQEPPPPPSGYLTLIPLSDSRLQPRDTRLTAAFLLAFALLVAGAVFVTVPRGVSVGEISVRTDKMSWNTSKSTYQLKLLAKVPVYNPNFLRARVAGDLQVLFYRTEAGRAVIDSISLPPRASPKLLEVDIDASDVPSDYILAILSQCSTFPEVLIFFLKGRLKARYLFMTQELATIDTYFLISCRDPGNRLPMLPDG